MDKNTKLWVRQTEAWLKTYDNGMKSNLLIIKHCEETIDNLKKQIALERKEFALKQVLYKQTLAALNKYK